MGPVIIYNSVLGYPWIFASSIYVLQFLCQACVGNVVTYDIQYFGMFQRKEICLTSLWAQLSCADLRFYFKSQRCILSAIYQMFPQIRVQTYNGITLH